MTLSMRAHRILLASSFFLMLAACTEPVDAQSAGLGQPVAVTATARPMNQLDDQDQKEGRLVFSGGLRLDAADPRFGGISGLAVNTDGTRFLAVTDQGHWLWGNLEYDGRGWLAGVSEVRLAPILDPEGEPLDGKEMSDAESLTPLVAGDLSGDVFVAFERNHRVWRYAWGKEGAVARALSVTFNDAVMALPSNSGLEGIAAIDGTIFAAAEEGIEDGPEDANGDATETPLFMACLAACIEQTRTLRLHPPFAITDLSVTPDGSILTLERRFSPLTGVGAQLRLIPRENLSGDTLIDGPIIATFGTGDTIDNMEGLSVRAGPNGETFVYMVSDDNFNRGLQATLFLMFRLGGLESVQ